MLYSHCNDRPLPSLSPSHTSNVTGHLSHHTWSMSALPCCLCNWIVLLVVAKSSKACNAVTLLAPFGLTRVSDPVWYWPDPDLTSQKFANRFRIQTPLSWKFSIYFMMIFNKNFYFLRSLIFLHSFLASESGGWTGSGFSEIWKPDPDPGKK